MGDAKLPPQEEKLIACGVENHLAGHADLRLPDLSEEALGWVRRILQLAGRSKSAHPSHPACSETIDGVLIDEVETENVVLYDMDNTHFEGLCAKNPKAQNGKNKPKRHDCRQVAIGMAVDGRGLALAHDVFAGNIGETKTLAHMLDRLAAPGSRAGESLRKAGYRVEKGLRCGKNHHKNLTPL